MDLATIIINKFRMTVNFSIFTLHASFPGQGIDTFIPFPEGMFNLQLLEVGTWTEASAIKNKCSKE